MLHTPLRQQAFQAMDFSNKSDYEIPNVYLQFAEWSSTPVNRSLVGVMCSLSIMGSLTTMTTFASWKDLRTTSRKILFFLSMADLMLALSNVIGVCIPINDNVNNPKNPYCVAQSFLTTSFSIMSYLWTLTLAIYLYIAIVKNMQLLGKKLLPLFHVVNWCLGPLINAVALYKGMLGYAGEPFSGGWCWIYHIPVLDTRKKYAVSSDELIWVFIGGKGLEITVYTTIFVIYGVIKCKLHNELQERLRGPMEPEVLRAARDADRKLAFMPCMLLFGRLSGLIRLFINIFSIPQPNETLPTYHKVLLTLQGVGDSSQGFFNCILFCFLNHKVFNRIRETFLYRVCGMSRREDEDKERTFDSDKYGSFSIPEPYDESSRLISDRDGSS